MIARCDLAHPRRLARDVDIVRTEANARIDHGRAVQRKRPGRAQHHARAGDSSVNGSLILTGRDDEIAVVQRRTGGGACGFERVPARTGDCPADTVGRVRCEVRNRLSSGESARTVEEDVVVAARDGGEHGRV